LVLGCGDARLLAPNLTVGWRNLICVALCTTDRL